MEPTSRCGVAPPFRLSLRPPGRSRQRSCACRRRAWGGLPGVDGSMRGSSTIFFMAASRVALSGHSTHAKATVSSAVAWTARGHPEDLHEPMHRTQALDLGGIDLGTRLGLAPRRADDRARFGPRGRHGRNARSMAGVLLVDPLHWYRGRGRDRHELLVSGARVESACLFRIDPTSPHAGAARW